MKTRIVLSFLALMALLACKAFAFTAVPTSVATEVPTSVLPVPEIILTEALQALDGCRSGSGVVAVDHTVSFSCSNSADTIYTVSMTDFGSEAAAHAQFESGRGENPISCFHGYDLFETSPVGSDDQPSRINHQELYWQAGEWGVSVYASYDYGFYHFNASEFAEAVYTAGIEHGLFQAGACPATSPASP